MPWISREVIVNKSTSYGHEIPNNIEYAQLRDTWRVNMGESQALRNQALAMTVSSNEFNYGYQWVWCGIPIIRHPDDIVLQQEIMWELLPSFVIETGVARGGSVVLSSSLMSLFGHGGKVLGLDNQILPHAIDALNPWTSDGRIELLECDSSSGLAAERLGSFISGHSKPVLLVLDSDHSHRHVLAELNALAPLLPVGSIVMVADTIIEEMPPEYYPNRPWGRGSNPLTATQEFLGNNSDFKLDSRWTRRSLMGEFRDGILIKHK